MPISRFEASLSPHSHEVQNADEIDISPARPSSVIDGFLRITRRSTSSSSPTLYPPFQLSENTVIEKEHTDATGEIKAANHRIRLIRRMRAQQQVCEAATILPWCDDGHNLAVTYMSSGVTSKIELSSILSDKDDIKGHSYSYSLYQQPKFLIDEKRVNLTDFHTSDGLSGNIDTIHSGDSDEGLYSDDSICEVVHSGNNNSNLEDEDDKYVPLEHPSYMSSKGFPEYIINANTDRVIPHFIMELTSHTAAHQRLHIKLFLDNISMFLEYDDTTEAEWEMLIIVLFVLVRRRGGLTAIQKRYNTEVSDLSFLIIISLLGAPKDNPKFPEVITAMDRLMRRISYKKEEMLLDAYFVRPEPLCEGPLAIDAQRIKDISYLYPEWNTDNDVDSSDADVIDMVCESYYNCTSNSVLEKDGINLNFNSYLPRRIKNFKIKCVNRVLMEHIEAFLNCSVSIFQRGEQSFEQVGTPIDVINSNTTDMIPAAKARRDSSIKPIPKEEMKHIHYNIVHPFYYSIDSLDAEELGDLTEEEFLFFEHWFRCLPPSSEGTIRRDIVSQVVTRNVMMTSFNVESHKEYDKQQINDNNVPVPFHPCSLVNTEKQVGRELSQLADFTPEDNISNSIGKAATSLASFEHQKNVKIKSLMDVLKKDKFQKGICSSDKKTEVIFCDKSIAESDEFTYRTSRSKLFIGHSFLGSRFISDRCVREFYTTFPKGTCTFIQLLHFLYPRSHVKMLYRRCLCAVLRDDIVTVDKLLVRKGFVLEFIRTEKIKHLQKLFPVVLNKNKHVIHPGISQSKAAEWVDSGKMVPASVGPDDLSSPILTHYGSLLVDCFASSLSLTKSLNAVKNRINTSSTNPSQAEFSLDDDAMVIIRDLLQKERENILSKPPITDYDISVYDRPQVGGSKKEKEIDGNGRRKSMALNESTSNYITQRIYVEPKFTRVHRELKLLQRTDWGNGAIEAEEEIAQSGTEEERFLKMKEKDEKMTDFEIILGNSSFPVENSIILHPLRLTASLVTALRHWFDVIDWMGKKSLSFHQLQCLCLHEAHSRCQESSAMVTSFSEQQIPKVISNVKPIREMYFRIGYWRISLASLLEYKVGSTHEPWNLHTNSINICSGIRGASFQSQLETQNLKDVSEKVTREKTYSHISITFSDIIEYLFVGNEQPALMGASPATSSCKYIQSFERICRKEAFEILERVNAAVDRDTEDSIRRAKEHNQSYNEVLKLSSSGSSILKRDSTRRRSTIKFISDKSGPLKRAKTLNEADLTAKNIPKMNHSAFKDILTDFIKPITGVTALKTKLLFPMYTNDTFSISDSVQTPHFFENISDYFALHSGSKLPAPDIGNCNEIITDVSGLYTLQHPIHPHYILKSLNDGLRETSLYSTCLIRRRVVKTYRQAYRRELILEAMRKQEVNRRECKQDHIPIYYGPELLEKPVVLHGFYIKKSIFDLSNTFGAQKERYPQIAAILNVMDRSGFPPHWFFSNTSLIPGILKRAPSSALISVYRDFTFCTKPPKESIRLGAYMPITAEAAIGKDLDKKQERADIVATYYQSDSIQGLLDNPRQVPNAKIQILTNIAVNSNVKYRFVFEGYNFGVNASVNTIVVGTTNRSLLNAASPELYEFPEGWDTHTTFHGGKGVSKLTQYLGHRREVRPLFGADESFDASSSIDPTRNTEYICFELEARTFMNVGFGVSAWLCCHGYGGHHMLTLDFFHQDERIQ